MYCRKGRKYAQIRSGSRSHVQFQVQDQVQAKGIVEILSPKKPTLLFRNSLAKLHDSDKSPPKVVCVVRGKGGGIRTSGHGSLQDCVKYAQLLGRTECCTRRRWYCGPGHLELTQRHKAHYDDDQLDYGQKGKQCWPT